MKWGNRLMVALAASASVSAMAGAVYAYWQYSADDAEAEGGENAEKSTKVFTDKTKNSALEGLLEITTLGEVIDEESFAMEEFAINEMELLEGTEMNDLSGVNYLVHQDDSSDSDSDSDIDDHSKRNKISEYGTPRAGLE